MSKLPLPLGLAEAQRRRDAELSREMADKIKERIKRTRLFYLVVEFGEDTRLTTDQRLEDLIRLHVANVLVGFTSGSQPLVKILNVPPGQ